MFKNLNFSILLFREVNMKKIKFNIFQKVLIICCFIMVKPSVGLSQIVRCGVGDLNSTQVQSIRDQLNQYLSLGKSAISSQITIPIAVHVVRYDNGTSDVSDAVIEDQIDVLNSNYSGTNFQFSLYSIDRTNSTTWTTHYMGSTNETNMKQSLAADPSHILNLYLCAAPTGSTGALLGYATFP
jgi:hypothetical protein